MRHRGFATEVAVKTTWPSHAFVEFVEHYFDMLLACFRCFDSAYPSDPVPARKWGNILP